MSRWETCEKNKSSGRFLRPLLDSRDMLCLSIGHGVLHQFRCLWCNAINIYIRDAKFSSLRSGSRQTIARLEDMRRMHAEVTQYITQIARARVREDKIAL